MALNVWVKPPCGHSQPMVVVGVCLNLEFMCRECRRWFRVEGGGWTIMPDNRAESRGGKWAEVPDREPA